MGRNEPFPYSVYILDLCIFLISLDASTVSPVIAFVLTVLRWLFVTSRRSMVDPSVPSDLCLILGYSLWSARHTILDCLKQPLIFRLLVAKATTAAVLYLGSIFYAWRMHALKHSWASAILKQDALSSPWIVPSRTTHTRLFPKHHSFAYSYLTVAIPVGFRGWCWPMVSVDVPHGRSWFHVQASDHLDRGKPDMHLKDKLALFLRSQGVQDTDWTYAYLVTAPRFFGYSFNPVSFWYIYDERRTLKKMILEVNNTFDERRMYLLDSQLSEGVRDGGKFKQEWAKDFHVSPFNSRKGSYSLTASDPFSQDGGAMLPIDNTIVMSSSKGHGKIVARLKSEGDPINPRLLSRGQIVLFLLRWWWVGYFTFPRILYEAARLFIRRKLHVWFRPEVLNTTIGRNPSSTENTLQAFVDAYMAKVVLTSSLQTSVEYEQCDGTRLELRPAQLAHVSDATKQKPLRFRILTPAFYSRFPHYKSTREAIDREVLFTDEKNRTAWVSEPSILASLFADPDEETEKGEQGRPLDKSRLLRWSLHKQLRCPPSAQAYRDPMPEWKGEYRVTDIRPSRLSALDHFVLREREDGWLYLRCCATLFLAERFALGLVPLIHILDVAVRILLCSWVIVPGLVRPTGLTTTTTIDNKQGTAILQALAGPWILHWWSAMKGLPG